MIQLIDVIAQTIANDSVQTSVGEVFPIAHSLKTACVVLSYRTPTHGDSLFNRVRWAKMVVCECMFYTSAIS
jgi:hypothetical protein